jgi:hypothetical protein
MWAHGPRPRECGPCSRSWRGPRPRGAGPGLASGTVMRTAQPGRPAQRAAHGVNARDAHGGAVRGGGASRRRPTGARKSAEETGRGSLARGQRRGSTTDPGISGFRLRRSGRRRKERGERRREGRGCRGGGRGAVGMTFKPLRACPDSAAHGSQSGLGAARCCH